MLRRSSTGDLFLFHEKPRRFRPSAQYKTDDTVRLIGEGQEVRTPTSVRSQSDQGREGHCDLHGKGDGPDPANQPQSDVDEARNDFGACPEITFFSIAFRESTTLRA